MWVKEESEKAGLKLNITKSKSWHPAPSLRGKQNGKRWEQGCISCSDITADGDCSHGIRGQLLLGRTAMTNEDSV